MNSIRIRQATAADADQIIAMESLFPSDRLSARSVRGLLKSASAKIWVADASAQIVGNLVLLLRARSRVARIYSLVVAPAARGQRIAERLIAAAESCAQDQGRIRMTLEVRCDASSARKLYARLGYRESRRLPNFYDDGVDGFSLIKLIG